VNRQDFKDIANVRLREAKVLLQTRNYSGAYYLCGYVLECGLKACIAKQTRRFDFPDKVTVRDSYSHDLLQLVKVAGLLTDLSNKSNTNPIFRGHWTIVKDWSEESRYERHSQIEASNLYEAVADPPDGVLQWIKQHW
jgi:hypothetical protein